MKRGDLYRIHKPTSQDPRRSRVYVVVSRQVVIDSRFSTVVCAPVFSVYDGLATQVPVGVEDGLKHDSSIHCDELMSLPKSLCTDFVGSLTGIKLLQLNTALMTALGVPY